MHVPEQVRRILLHGKLRRACRVMDGLYMAHSSAERIAEQPRLIRRLLTMAVDCLFLLRISLLAPVWTIIILGWVTAAPQALAGGSVAAGFGIGESLLWLSLGSFSLIVAAIYVVNQIADIESDRINHKLFLLPRGIIPVRVAWTLALLCAGCGMLVAAIFLDGIMLSFYAVALLLGYLYNLPPARLKDRAWGGAVANFLGHGALSYLVGWHAAHIATGGSEPLLTGFVASLSPGFANAAVYITTTIADAEGDRLTGKRTFSVVYGERTTALVATIACLAALLLAFTLTHNRWVMAVPAAISVFFFGYLWIMPRRDAAFRAFKWPVFILTASVTLYVPLYAVLVLLTFAASRTYYRRRFGIEYPTFKAQ
jgi:4-hydroxybenzoate polyprenyltransferase